MSRNCAPGPALSGGCGPKKSSTAKTLEGLVEEYLHGQTCTGTTGETLRSLLKHYRGMKSLNEVIETAAYATNAAGKRHGHQRRIPKIAMESAEKTLKAGIKKVDSFRSFEELHDWFADHCSAISRLGPLYVYDTCLRIGAFLKLAPKHVYLHSGVLVGARALGLDVRLKKLPRNHFPPALRVLKSHEIEDFLCIYKGVLNKVHAAP